MGGLLLRGSPPPPLAHAGAPQLYSTTTPADYLMLASRPLTAATPASTASASTATQEQQGQGGAGGLQGETMDVSAEAEAQALTALAADAAAAARFASPGSTSTAVSAAYTGKQAHQHQHATAVAAEAGGEGGGGAGAGRGGLSLDVAGWARRGRVGGQTSTPTPSTGGSGGEYGAGVSPGGNGQPPQQAAVGRVWSLASSLGGEEGGGCGGSPLHHGQGPGEEAPGLMFEMSMDEVLDAGVGGLRLSSPRPPSAMGEGERVLGVTHTQTLYPPLVEAAGGGLINVRVEEGKGGAGHHHHHYHHHQQHHAAATEGEWDGAGEAGATGRLSVSPGAGGRAGRRRPRPVGAEEGRELGWSFGVISLQGIRKNQEDQVICGCLCSVLYLCV